MNERQWSFSGGGFEKEFGYARAVRQGDHIYVSGCAPIEQDGSAKPDAAGQANRCFEIISQALQALDGAMEDVVRVRFYLAAADDLEAVMAMHRIWLGAARPAATAVVTGLLNPAWKVEIEAEAVARHSLAATV